MELRRRIYLAKAGAWINVDNATATIADTTVILGQESNALPRLIFSTSGANYEGMNPV